MKVILDREYGYTCKTLKGQNKALMAMKAIF